MKEPNFIVWGNMLEERIQNGGIPHGELANQIQSAWVQGREYEKHRLETLPHAKWSPPKKIPTPTIVQILNPKTNKYTKLDKTKGCVLGNKKTPYKGVPIVETPTPHIMSTTLSPPPKNNDKEEIKTLSQKLVEKYKTVLKALSER